MWNCINTEAVTTAQTQSITHTLVTHNNKSALTIAVQDTLSPRSPSNKASIRDVHIKYLKVCFKRESI